MCEYTGNSAVVTRSFGRKLKNAGTSSLEAKESDNFLKVAAV